MKKDVFVYLIIFIISFGVTAGFLYFVSQKKINASPTDSTAVKSTVNNTVQKVQEKMTDTIKAAADTANQDQGEFKSFVSQLKSLYTDTKKPKTEKELEKIQKNVDSLLTVMNKKIDSLRTLNKKYEKQIDNLHRELASDDAIIRKQSEQIKGMDANYKNKIDAINKENAAKEKHQEETNVKELAKIYNKMDAKKVAGILQNMPSEKAIQILRFMSPKKTAQILSALPPAVATSYSQKMSEK